MILWAARMPEGNKDPSSRSVLASPLPHSQEGKWKSHHPEKDSNSCPTYYVPRLPFPTGLKQGKFSRPVPSPPPPAGRRVMAHPSAHSTPYLLL